YKVIFTTVRGCAFIPHLSADASEEGDFPLCLCAPKLKPQQETSESLAFRKELSTLNRLQYCEIPLPFSLRLPRKGSFRLRR
ncbi:hypothetical protein EO95_12730, partial [Methanosarcina sp. 1.H.T.1A.1]